MIEISKHPDIRECHAMLGQNMAFSDVLMLFNESREFISREIATIKSKLMEHGKALTGHPCERAGLHQLVAGGNRSTRLSLRNPAVSA